MDYYIVINEQKQGPFDFLAVIKKVKNGTIKPDTLVSAGSDNNFVPAEQVGEIRKVFESDAASSHTHNQAVVVSFKTALLEGVDLWTRKIINFTIALGVIFVIGFGFSQGIKHIQIIADYSFIADYLTGVLCYAMLGMFFYYVLQSKRNQEVNLNDVQAVLVNSLLPLLLFALVISLLNVIYTISMAGFIIGSAIATAVYTFSAFIPFLITDHKMTFPKAVSANIRQFKIMDKSCGFSVFMLMAMNTVTAMVLGLISPNLMIIGMIITVPITVSAIAYIYDQVFA